MIRFYILLSIFLIIFSSCEKKPNIQEIDTEAIMDQISDQDIQRLKNKKVFFGHMSVGYNIIDGLEDLKIDDQRLSDLSIIELNDNNINKPGIYHKKNGKNGLPESKCEAFRNYLLEDSLGKQFDIALFKFCYVDFGEDTDIEAIFDKYVQTIESIKKDFSNLEIIHTTTPLLAHNFSLKNKIKNIITGDLANIKRNQFNKLVYSKYVNDDLIFDLAGIESTYPDENREYFTSKGEKYYSLIKEYTYDGGHLNNVGRKWVALEFLKVLVKSK